MRLLGNAAIEWTDDDGDHVLELRAPLRMVSPGIRQTRWVRESADFLTREVATLGSGVHELVGTIRYADNPSVLASMLLAGVRGETLTYVPDVDDPDRSFDCWLIEPNETASAQMDIDQGFPGKEENQVQIRLRRTNGQPFV